MKKSDDSQSNLMMNKVIKTLQMGKDFESVLPELFKTLAETLDGQWIGYWQVDATGSVLKLLSHWHHSTILPTALNKDVSTRALSPGEGMPGKVWRGRKPAVSSDIVKDMMLPKSLKAREAGLHGAYWIPVCSNGTVYGVFEILRTMADSEAFIDLPTLELLGMEIGSFIKTTSIK